MIRYLGYTLPFTKDDLSKIKDFYYGGYKKDEEYYDKFFCIYSKMDNNHKSLTLYMVFDTMIRKHTENLSQDEQENARSNIFFTIAKNIEKLDIKYRGLAKYIKAIVSTRVMNERNLSKKYASLVDDNVIIEKLQDGAEEDRDYSINYTDIFDEFIRRNGEYGQLVADVYQNDIKTAKGLLSRCLQVEPGYDRDRLKAVCKEMIKNIKDRKLV